MRLPIETGLLHRSTVVAQRPPASAFKYVGGREGVAKLVDGLYTRIEADPVLRPAFNRDLTRERQMQTVFFETWFGGEPDYFDAWHPGLQIRHRKISISRGMADRWLSHFLTSLTEVSGDAAFVEQVRPAVTGLAMGLVNRKTEPVKGERLRGSCAMGELRPFLRAVRENCPDELAALAAATPGVLPMHGGLLLLMAAVRGKPEVAEELLRQGVDPNRTDTLPKTESGSPGLSDLYVTPLCGALAKKRQAMAELLVAHEAKYDIFSASCLGDLDAMRSMLDLAPELVDAHDPACDVAGITPLKHAVTAGQIAAARLLLERGAKVGPNSIRLVTDAAEEGNEDLVDLLLEHGADASRLGAGYWTTYPTLADKLLARGANVNRVPGKWIGLCCTGNSGHLENLMLAKSLLRCGADVSARYGGRSALHCAAQAGFINVMAALIEAGGDVNALDDQGETPLDAVEQAGKTIDKEGVKAFLVANGAVTRSGRIR